MTDPGPRYCPRCRTALVADLPFCPRCGLNSAEVDDRAGSSADPGYPPVDALGRSLDAGPRTTSPTSTAAPRQFVDRASQGTAIVFGALVIAAGLAIFGLFMRPQGAGNPAPAPQGGSSSQSGSPAGPAAPIVGLTITSPRDGEAVATKEVTVIGLAPPGLTITRDVSFGLDQHATTDGTGHWAINVGLDEGQNDLVFRIGDDRSTEKRLRVIYAPPSAP